MRLQMVLIRYIIRMRDGRSRILKNGGAQSARQQRKRYRKPESHQKKSPEWELTDRAGRVMKKAPDKKNGEDGLPIPPYAVYNIGNQNPENLLDFVQILSEELVRAKVLPEDYDFEAHKELVPMQPGDVFSQNLVPGFNSAPHCVHVAIVSASFYKVIF